MIELEVVWTYLGAEGFVRRGSRITVPPERARALIARGLAREVKPAGPSETKPAGPSETKPEGVESEEEPGMGQVVAGGLSYAYRCGECGREFQTRQGLASHQQRRHGIAPARPERLSE